jgi:NADH dehydrogenase [ubiquinone] 1 alpha subcomplex assembly factor 7
VSEARLLQKLRGLIRANGPMSVAEYMAHCLSDPEDGYYTTRDPFGAAGDFVTAPEVSQMFGEIAGAWLVDVWRRLGAPAPVNLVELGPGRGTLMADALRVARRAADFWGAAAIHLVETSPALRQRQAETLRQSGADVTWHTDFSDVPDGPILLVANEFFDALPIRQFVRLDEWRERVVGLDPRDRLIFGIGPGVLECAVKAPHGSVLEVRPAADAVVAAIAARIATRGGAALIIDYGHAETAPGETFQAVRGHTFADPLAAPGVTDLTAHVDFGALARAARREGAAAHGPKPQGEFLTALGLMERAGRLGAGADSAGRAAIRAAVERLAGPDQMGTLFKVLALTPPGLVPPPFGE